MSLKVLYTTVPDEKTADEIAEKMVREKLCACVNYYPIRSVYVWQGDVQKDGEYGMWFKTTDDRVQELAERVKELHPYSVPAVLVWSVDVLNDDYEKWAKEVTR